MSQRGPGYVREPRWDDILTLPHQGILCRFEQHNVMDTDPLMNGSTFHHDCIIRVDLKTREGAGADERQFGIGSMDVEKNKVIDLIFDRIPSTTPGAEPPRDARDSGSARSHSTHLETSSSNRP